MRIWASVCLLIILFTEGLVSCGTKEHTFQVEKRSDKAFTSIGKGALFGGGQEGFSETEQSLVVVRSAQEWEEVKAKMNSVNTITGGFKEVDLDFENEMVLVCIDKLRGSGGYELVIETLMEGEEDIEVWVRSIAPGDMAASVLTQPYHVVRTEKSEKEFKLKLALE